MTARPAILIVDDELPILDGLRLLLRKQRDAWEVVFVLGGQLALAELRRRPFDVVVTDLRMPELDGVALLRQIRAEFPAVQRIILSGQADPETRDAARALAPRFLCKPCAGEQLRVAIASALAEARER